MLFYVYKPTIVCFFLYLNFVFIYLSRIVLISMQMPKYLFLTLFCVFGFTNSTNAQFGFSHEIGAIAGPVAFQSDYGERHNLSTNAGNSGYGIGIIHYLNFSYKADCNCYTPETYFNDHFNPFIGSIASKTSRLELGRCLFSAAVHEGNGARSAGVWRSGDGGHAAV